MLSHKTANLHVGIISLIVSVILRSLTCLRYKFESEILDKFICCFFFIHSAVFLEFPTSYPPS